MASDAGAGDVDRSRGAAGDMSQRSDESVVGQDLWMESAGGLAQLVDGLIEVLAYFSERLAETRIAVGHLAGERKPDAHRYEALLDAVVDVALEQLSLLIDGLDDALEGSAHFGEPVRWHRRITSCPRLGRHRANGMNTPDRPARSSESATHPIRAMRAHGVPG